MARFDLYVPRVAVATYMWFRRSLKTGVSDYSVNYANVRNNFDFKKRNMRLFCEGFGGADGAVGEDVNADEDLPRSGAAYC